MVLSRWKRGSGVDQSTRWCVLPFSFLSLAHFKRLTPSFSTIDNFSTLCVVQADLSLLSGSAEPKQGKNGKKYWTIVFSVEIHFGLTEFKARMKWKDKVCCCFLILTHLILTFSDS